MTNPAAVIAHLMGEQSMTATALSESLSVPVFDVLALMQGNSPDASLIKPLAGLLGVSEQFIRAVYSAPGNDRDVALNAVLDGRQAA